MSEEESEAPKSGFQLGKNMNVIIGVVLLAVVGFFAYMFMGEKVVEEQVRVENNKVETKKQEVESKNKAEADRAMQREESERKHALLMEQQRIQAAEREAIRAKQAADQAAAQEAQAAQTAAAEERQRSQKEELERRRRDLAVKKLISLRNLAQNDLEKFKAEMSKIDTELDRLIPLCADEVAEKLRSGTVAANNQIKYNEKKIEEVNLQIREYQRKPGSQELVAQAQRKIESIRIEQERFETAIQKNAEETTLLNRNRQAIKDLLSRRANLQKTIGRQVVELKQLRGDPSFSDLVKVGGSEELEKMIVEATALMNKEAPDGTIRKVAPKPEPVAANPSNRTTESSPGVTVSAKKDKVTVYTLKNGKTVSATKSIEAGDMISVKTLDGKFQSIAKEDIVKEELREE